MNTQQQILEELKTMNTNMQNIKGAIQKTNAPKKACYYPQTQAIEFTSSYTKAIRGVKTGRNFMLAGVIIAAGLSNGLSALNLIPEYTYGIYGGIIALGITTTIVGVITMAVYAIKSGIKDNPNLVKNYSYSSDNGAAQHLKDLVHSPIYTGVSGNIYHYNKY